MTPLRASLSRSAMKLDNGCMKRASSESWMVYARPRNARGRIEWTAASVLLALGAAALIGWLVLELYVGVVTVD
ncbi:hypothetical protein ACSFA8_26440 [Variovorax sp. RT4R15]|uniref:hypothetical protein n=1 Tax=Variovorax sp. RT4R15 TaxID=3443737 RepID=UPI003F45C033